MHKFQSPPQHFLTEMIQANISHSRSPLVFDGVPRAVLEKVVHHTTICSLLDEPSPKIDITLGPDADYHHEIKGIASVTPRLASLFYKDDDGDDWYSVLLTVNSVRDFELLISKLGKDESEWELLELPTEEEKISELAFDALTYLGIAD